MLKTATPGRYGVLEEDRAKVLQFPSCATPECSRGWLGPRAADAGTASTCSPVLFVLDVEHIEDQAEDVVFEECVMGILDDYRGIVLHVGNGNVVPHAAEA